MSRATAVLDSSLKGENMVCRILLIFGLLLLSTPGFGGHRRQARINGKTLQEQSSRGQLEAFLSREFGASVRLLGPERDKYVIGDFNGDGNPDLAVIVDVQNARDELVKHGIKLIDTDAWSATNGSTLEMDKLEVHNCAGLAIVHGSTNGWTEPSARLLSYDCFSSAKLFPKRRRVRSVARLGTTAPRLLGDGVVVELENGATSLIYWTPKGYRGYGLAAYD